MKFLHYELFIKIFKSFHKLNINFVNLDEIFKENNYKIIKI